MVQIESLLAVLVTWSSAEVWYRSIYSTSTATMRVLIVAAVLCGKW